MKFMDSDISMHAILIKGLDRKIPYETMEDTLKKTFEKLLPGPKVIASRVLP